MIFIHRGPGAWSNQRASRRSFLLGPNMVNNFCRDCHGSWNLQFSRDVKVKLISVFWTPQRNGDFMVILWWFYGKFYCEFLFFFWQGPLPIFSRSSKNRLILMQAADRGCHLFTWLRERRLAWHALSRVILPRFSMFRITWVAYGWNYDSNVGETMSSTIPQSSP